MAGIPGMDGRRFILDVDDTFCISIRAAWRYVEPVLGQAVSSFLDLSKDHPEVGKHTQVLSTALRDHFRILFKGSFDDEYLLSAQDIAALEYSCGMDAKIRVCAAHHVLKAVRASLTNPFRRGRSLFVLDVVNRAFAFDLANAIALHTASERTQVSKRLKKLNEIIASFEEAVGNGRSALDDTVAALIVAADAMKASVGKASERISVAENAMCETLAAATGTAGATEEFSSTISEIRSQTDRNAENVTRALGIANEAHQRIDELSGEIDKIGQIAGVIAEIAAQTNLLALNASIEAARAGQAGKGFGVVASEVKSLAIKTAQATEQIALQISTIQDSTREMVAKILDVSVVTKTASEVTNFIASAVTQQSASAVEISHNAQIAFDRVKTLSDAVVVIDNSIELVTGGASEVLRCADTISDQTKRFDRAVADLVGSLSDIS